jgi:Na+-transporting NADH:ubiquinone oxidoreductase subunit NqrB
MINMAKRQTLHIWIAILAVLFSALAPTISHALNASSSSDMIEICTANGYKLVKVAGADEGKAPASVKQGMEHCAFCTTHGSSHALTGFPSVTIALAGGRDIYPPLFYTAPQSLHAWSTANPRAPPLFI